MRTKPTRFARAANRWCGMPDFSAPVLTSFITETVLVIFAVIGIGILAVRRAKNAKDEM